MSWDDLKRAKKVVGTKQVAKAVEKGIVRKVYIAKDADQHITAPLLRLCEERGVRSRVRGFYAGVRSSLRTECGGGILRHTFPIDTEGRWLSDHN